MLLLAALLMLSCGKASQEVTFANQETRIASYIDTEVKAGASFVDNGGIYCVIDVHRYINGTDTDYALY